MDYRNWRQLIRPKKLEVDHETLTPKYGRFVAEPLERGFGITVGNSLRRILLSSLRGAAIIGCEIEGALHEFCLFYTSLSPRDRTRSRMPSSA